MRTMLGKWRRSKNSGFTLIELLVVIAIIGVLVALLLPAVQKAREAAARTQCVNNMKQMGIALHTFADIRKAFPTSGEVQTPDGTATAFDKHSTFTLMLPYIEQQDIFNSMDLTKFYNDVENRTAAKFVVPTYLCPTNSIRPRSGRDAMGYGYTDYMPVAYTNLANTTFGNPAVDSGPRVIGGLGGTAVGTGTGTYTAYANTPIEGYQLGHSVTDVTDGLSKTVAMCEDVGRSEIFGTPKYADPVGAELLGGASGATGKRNAWRWGEPDSGNGISGPSGSTPASLAGQTPVINQNAQPYGGPASCLWTLNNCGVNDEPFSFHGDGANFLFLDGHVTLLSKTVDIVVLRRLLTHNEGLPIATNPGGTALPVPFGDY